MGSLYNRLMLESVITKRVRDDAAYFTIRWSRLKKADKYDIVRSVPSVGGIYELYYMDHKKKLNLAFFAHAWYGGLRSTIRKLIDAELAVDPKLRELLESHDIYYRYSCTDSNQDMVDVIFFFNSIHFPGSRRQEDSGRYSVIYVDEISADKLITI